MRISKLLMPAVTLAGALALAGCGGGGGTTPPPPPPEGLEPGESSDPIGDPPMIYTCDENHDGNCDFDPDNPPTSDEEAEEAGIIITNATPTQTQTPTQTSITTEADKAKADAETAYKKAADVADGKTPKTGFVAVNGVSADAVANAKAILDAETEINAALADAEAALEKAKGLPDTAVGKARLVASIEADIEKIEENQEKVENLAKDIRGGNRAKPYDAAHWGTEAAKGLDGALIDSDGIRDQAGDEDGLAAASGVLFHGSTRSSGAKRFVNAPAKGDTLTGTLAAAARGGIGTGSITFGGSTQAGTFVCLAESCAAVATGTKIGDGWHFTVTDTGQQNNWYVRNDDDTGYVQATYLEWGMWFNNANALQSFAGQGAGSGTVTRGVINADIAALNTTTTATYTGEAEGLSTFRASTGGADPAAVRSGHFTADVKLEATFGASDQTLEGMINGFEGPAVNTGWKIDIPSHTLTPGGGTATPTGGGRFTHQTYGETGQRPTGIVGTFGKNFSDGAVAGVYHAD